VGENLLNVGPEHWLGFVALVLVLLFLDLVIFHRRAHAPSLFESTVWSVVWIGLALVFNGFIWWWGWIEHNSSEAGMKFLTGYLVEKSLSVDNLFVFAVIFRFFQVQLKYQYRVLFWGILGAIVMRFLFILLGVELIHRFDWMLVIFGLFLVYTGFKLAFGDDEKVDPERNVLLRTARRLLRITREDHGQRFFARENGVLCITPLLLVLLVVESTDVLFAVDSVPAVIGITKDPFLVFSSNVFAILGLRALYFLLAGVLDRFRFLHYGLSAVLVFIGLKMMAEYVAEEFFHHKGPLVPAWVSLLVVGGLLVLSIIPSLLLSARKPDKDREKPADNAP